MKRNGAAAERQADEAHSTGFIREMTGPLRPTAQDDLPALAQFLARVYKFGPADFHADPRWLQWKYFSPLSGWRGGRSYLLEKDGRIAAHGGVCPVTLRLPSGQTVSSITILDWAADPSTPGSGVHLYRTLMEMASTSFVIGGTPVTRQIIPRIGFRQVGEALSYAAWLRPWSEFRLRFRAPRSALALLHGLTHPARNRRPASAGWDCDSVHQFDDSILPILNGSQRSWTFCQRTVADLNCLLQCPHIKIQGFLLRRQGRLLGYFIIGKMQWEARLLDLALDSADANDWNLACAMVTEAARVDPEVSRIRTQSTLPALTEALRWNGYWLQHREPVLVHDPANALEGAFPVSFQLVDGDSGY